MQTFLFYILVSLLFLGCNQKNKNTAGNIIEESKLVESRDTTSASSIVVKESQDMENATVVKFEFANEVLFDRPDFSNNVVIHNGVIVVQLLKDKEEVIFTLGGIKAFDQKPYKGNFTSTPSEKETTVLVDMHI
ncbi:MAG: hypothetical protein H0X63_12140 [Flavobacteriales bacterium]|nr:hypothetical protein [Flavobacteriales bacterium]